MFDDYFLSFQTVLWEQKIKILLISKCLSLIFILRSYCIKPFILLMRSWKFFFKTTIIITYKSNVLLTLFSFTMISFNDISYFFNLKLVYRIFLKKNNLHKDLNKNLHKDYKKKYNKSNKSENKNIAKF